MGDGPGRDRRKVVGKRRAGVEEHARAAARAVLDGDGERARKRADLFSAGSQLAVEGDVGEPVRADVTGGGQDGHRDGQRDGGRGLPQRRGRDVDCHAALREPVAAAEDGCAHGFAKLAGGGVGEADDREGREPGADVAFDGDAPGSGRRGERMWRSETMGDELLEVRVLGGAASRDRG